MSNYVVEIENEVDFLEVPDGMGPRGIAGVICVPTGTTGWAAQPDGTLWVEYTP